MPSIFQRLRFGSDEFRGARGREGLRRCNCLTSLSTGFAAEAACYAVVADGLTLRPLAAVDSICCQYAMPVRD